MRPVLFEFGNFKLHSFGVLLLIAFFASVWFARKRAPKFQMDPNKVSDLSFWALLAGVLGARVVFITQEWKYYAAHPNELWSLQFQGLTSFGGLLFGLAAFLIGAKLIRRSPLDILDVVAPAALIGHAIGRIGCFFNGCCYGRVCPADAPYAVMMNGQYHIPAQLLDSFLNIAGLVALLAIEKRGLSRGQPLALFLIFHGLSRFIYEFFRAGTVAEVNSNIASSTYWDGLPITEAQAMAAVLTLFGVILYAMWNRKGVVQQVVPVG